MEIEYDFQEHAESLILPQFKNSPRLKEFVKALVKPAQDSLDGINQINNAYDLRTAVGQQLDTIGKLLNTARNNRSDEDYRAALKGRVLVNNATGSASNFISLLKLALGDIQFQVIEQFPATVRVFIYSPQNIIDEQLVNDIVPVGVQGIFSQNPYIDKTVFEFGEVSGVDIIGGTVVPEVADLQTSDVVLSEVIYT